MVSEKNSATSEFNRERICTALPSSEWFPFATVSEFTSLCDFAIGIRIEGTANDSENMPTSSPNMSSQKCDHTDAAETTQLTENSRIFFA